MTKGDVNWNKNLHIKMLKMALFDCVINQKCRSVDGGRGICPLFPCPPRGIWQLKSPRSREFAIQGKKMLMPGGQPRGVLGAGGIDWCIILYTFYCNLSAIFVSNLCARLNSKIVSYCLTDISPVTSPDNGWLLLWPKRQCSLKQKWMNTSQDLAST